MEFVKDLPVPLTDGLVPSRLRLLSELADMGKGYEENEVAYPGLSG